jgi:hypothetical protein
MCFWPRLCILQADALSGEGQLAAGGRTVAEVILYYGRNYLAMSPRWSDAIAAARHAQGMTRALCLADEVFGIQGHRVHTEIEFATRREQGGLPIGQRFHELPISSPVPLALFLATYH